MEDSRWGLTRAEQRARIPPSPCWPCCFGCSPGYGWPSELQAHIASSYLVFHPPISPNEIFSWQRVPLCASQTDNKPSLGFENWVLLCWRLLLFCPRFLPLEEDVGGKNQGGALGCACHGTSSSSVSSARLRGCGNSCLLVTARSRLAASCRGAAASPLPPCFPPKAAGKGKQGKKD